MFHRYTPGMYIDANHSWPVNTLIARKTPCVGVCLVCKSFVTASDLSSLILQFMKDYADSLSV